MIKNEQVFFNILSWISSHIRRSLNYWQQHMSSSIQLFSTIRNIGSKYLRRCGEWITSCKLWFRNHDRIIPMKNDEYFKIILQICNVKSTVDHLASYITFMCIAISDFVHRLCIDFWAISWNCRFVWFSKTI